MGYMTNIENLITAVRDLNIGLCFLLVLVLIFLICIFSRLGTIKMLLEVYLHQNKDSDS